MAQRDATRRVRLQELPQFSHGWTFLYADQVRVEREQNGIELRDGTGRVAVPVAQLSALLLGPGATVTHAAMAALAEGGCSVVWCGEGVVRFYAAGVGETRRSRHLLRQAQLWAHEDARHEVVMRLYRQRFNEPLDPALTLQQVRGREGVRVREAYARASRETGVPWRGRNYEHGSWSAADAVNRALSTANACLYGVCHAGIAAAGFSPGLGFIHTGKLLSFVYDIADLYKAEVTVPVAFKAAADGAAGLEGRVRRLCRARFREAHLLRRIVPDVQRALGLAPEAARVLEWRTGCDDEPGLLWDPEARVILGGRNYADVPEVTGSAVEESGVDLP